MHTEPLAESLGAFSTFLGTPLPDDPIAALQRLRSEAADEVERLLSLIDAIDGDPDVEPNGDEQDDDRQDEPSLGWPVAGPAGDRSNEQPFVDAELDLADAEPSLAAPEAVTALDARWSQVGWARGNSDDMESSTGRNDDDEDSDHSGCGDLGGMLEQTGGEPDLGATEAIDQRTAWAAQTDEDWNVENDEAMLAGTAAEDANGTAGRTNGDRGVDPDQNWRQRLKARRGDRDVGRKPQPIGNVNLANSIPVVMYVDTKGECNPILQLRGRPMSRAESQCADASRSSARC
jgi:hypothetical protein